ncbi:RHS repeat-associated core domain-containing protein [Facilibium subflavum]|uniref:RHS repeat-associated core domain-containing protein n=1 Tax=Facilibium subflavum TaxID=2219058 RepID=UPI001AAD683F|nr:RHS repeat-associated core domain-containing protein [Facilibium subflavum]
MLKPLNMGDNYRHYSHFTPYFTNYFYNIAYPSAEIQVGDKAIQRQIYYPERLEVTLADRLLFGSPEYTPRTLLSQQIISAQNPNTIYKGIVNQTGEMTIGIFHDNLAADQKISYNYHALGGDVYLDSIIEQSGTRSNSSSEKYILSEGKHVDPFLSKETIIDERSKQEFTLYKDVYQYKNDLENLKKQKMRTTLLRHVTETSSDAQVTYIEKIASGTRPLQMTINSQDNGLMRFEQTQGNEYHLVGLSKDISQSDTRKPLNASLADYKIAVDYMPNKQDLKTRRTYTGNASDVLTKLLGNKENSLINNKKRSVINFDKSRHQVMIQGENGDEIIFDTYTKKPIQMVKNSNKRPIKIDFYYDQFNQLSQIYLNQHKLKDIYYYKAFNKFGYPWLNAITTVSDNGYAETIYRDEIGHEIARTDNLRSDLENTVTIDGEHIIALQKYDTYGNITKQVDDLGREINYSYDELNRLVKQIDPNGNTYTHEYNLLKNSQTVYLNNALLWSEYYDGEGKVIQRRDYKTKSHRIEDIMPKDKIYVQYFTYAGDGNVIRQDDYELTKFINMSGYTHMLDDIFLSVNYEKHQEIKYGLNNHILSKTIKQQDNIPSTRKGDSLVYDTKTYSYQYNAQGQKVSMTVSENNASNHSVESNDSINKIEVNLLRDKHGNLQKLDLNRDFSSQTYYYNAQGKVEKSCDNQGHCKIYHFDESGSLTGYTNESGVDFTVFYGDNFISVKHREVGSKENESQLVEEVTAYNDAGQITEQKTFLNNSTTPDKYVRYLYTKDGLLEKKVYPDGSAISYAYDAAQRIIMVKGVLDNVQTYEYDRYFPAKVAKSTVFSLDKPNDQMSVSIDYEKDPYSPSYGKALTYYYSNGVQKQISYNQNGLVSSIYYTDNQFKAPANEILRYKYIYNDKNKLQSVISQSPFNAVNSSNFDSNFILEYKYNTKDQLQIETYRGQKSQYYRNYSWDINNNLRSLDTHCIAGKCQNETWTGKYNSDNQLMQSSLDSVVTNFTYDSRGNRISSSDGIVYRYDQSNRLIQIDDNGKLTNFSYLPGSDLLWKQTNHEHSTYFYYDDSSIPKLLAKHDHDNFISYNYNADQLLMRVKSIESQSVPHEQTMSIALSGLRDVAGFLEQGKSRQSLDKIATFEAQQGNIETILQDDSFEKYGEYHDKNSGLIYLRHRYFDNKNNQFIQKDPFSKMMTNRYQYANSDPVNFVDPLGLDAMNTTREAPYTTNISSASIEYKDYMTYAMVGLGLSIITLFFDAVTLTNQAVSFIRMYDLGIFLSERTSTILRLGWDMLGVTLETLFIATGSDNPELFFGVMALSLLSTFPMFFNFVNDLYSIIKIRRTRITSSYIRVAAPRFINRFLENTEDYVGNLDFRAQRDFFTTGIANHIIGGYVADYKFLGWRMKEPKAVRGHMVSPSLQASSLQASYQLYRRYPVGGVHHGAHQYEFYNNWYLHFSFTPKLFYRDIKILDYRAKILPPYIPSILVDV